MGSTWHLVLCDPRKDLGPVLADSKLGLGPKAAECGCVMNDLTVLKKAKNGCPIR